MSKKSIRFPYSSNSPSNKGIFVRIIKKYFSMSYKYLSEFCCLNYLISKYILLFL